MRKALLVGAVHGIVAAAAVVGFLALICARAGESDNLDHLVQATGLVALIWAYAGLVLGLLIASGRWEGAGRRDPVPVRSLRRDPALVHSGRAVRWRWARIGRSISPCSP